MKSDSNWILYYFLHRIESEYNAGINARTSDTMADQSSSDGLPHHVCPFLGSRYYAVSAELLHSLNIKLIFPLFSWFSMSKEDLIQICGLADGIRMFNILRAKWVDKQLNIIAQWC